MSQDDANSPPGAPGAPRGPVDPLRELERVIRGESDAEPAAAPSAPAPPPEGEAEEAPEAASEGPTSPPLEALVAAIDADLSASPLQIAPSPAEPSRDERALQRVIVFKAAETRYALAMGQMIEVGPVPAVTPLPRVPSWLLGVSNLRGEILAVLDLRGMLDLPPKAASDKDRLLVLQTGSGRTAGLVVDQVLGMGAVDPAAIRPPAALVEGAVREFLAGVTEQDGHLLAILDAERLLASRELVALTDAQLNPDLGSPLGPRFAAAEPQGSSPTL